MIETAIWIYLYVAGGTFTTAMIGALERYESQWHRLIDFVLWPLSLPHAAGCAVGLLIKKR